MTPRIRVAVLFGGASEEHDVSVRSAAEIASSIDTDKYEPIYLGIARSGEWSLCGRPCADWELAAGPRAVISPDPAIHGVVAATDGQIIRVDAAFPVLHGRNGEDGAIQGLLELAGIPYVGCGIEASAICMDKSLAYTVARAAGIGTPEFDVLMPWDPMPTGAVQLPAFVKPARSGSSFGVSKVEAIEDLARGIAEARRFDEKVLIERSVEGTEVGCAVLGRSPDLTFGALDQIDVSHGLFRIHQEAEPEAGSANATVTVPAELPERQAERVRCTAAAIYSALGCRGLARVDMFLRPGGEIVLNEVNTMPGFTSYSRYPRMMSAAGLELSDVVDHCITEALAR